MTQHAFMQHDAMYELNWGVCQFPEVCGKISEKGKPNCVRFRDQRVIILTNQNTRALMGIQVNTGDIEGPIYHIPHEKSATIVLLII